jgi:hypothetical protein
MHAGDALRRRRRLPFSFVRCWFLLFKGHGRSARFSKQNLAIIAAAAWYFASPSLDVDLKHSLFVLFSGENHLNSCDFCLNSMLDDSIIPSMLPMHVLNFTF